MSDDRQRRKSYRDGDEFFSKVEIKNLDQGGITGWALAIRVFFLLILATVVFSAVYFFYKIFGNNTFVKFSAVAAAIIVLLYIFFLMYILAEGILF